MSFSRICEHICNTHLYQIIRSCQARLVLTVPIIYLALEYELLAEKKECKGSDYTVGEVLPSLDDCATFCKNKANMFTFGRQGSLRCYCWLDTLNGECAKGVTDAAYYNLYRFKQGKAIGKGSKILSYLFFFKFQVFQVIVSLLVDTIGSVKWFMCLLIIATLCISLKFHPFLNEE